MSDRLNAITQRYEDLGQEPMHVGADYHGRGDQQNAPSLNLVLKSREYGRALKVSRKPGDPGIRK
jgi:hypothetical protein